MNKLAKILVALLALFAVAEAHAMRWYSPNTGRWLSRDSIEESGGANLYGFVANQPIGFIDILGNDFIAVASRPVKGTLTAFNHYSIQYRLACPGEAPKSEIFIREWALGRVGQKKYKSVQLLRDEGSPTPWKIWKQEGGQWKYVKTSVSVIHFDDSGTKFVSVFEGPPAAVKGKWRQIEMFSESYQYAEQAGFSGSFSHWPNSKYGLPWDEPFNNSNTFVREAVRQAGLQMIELSGDHPGNDKAEPVPDLYAGRKPSVWPSPPLPPSGP